MKSLKLSNSKKIGLFSAPWPIYSRPSIQLGSLKAWLKKQIPDLEVETYPFYLSVAEQLGYSCYQDISEKSWMAESVYASILFKERTTQIEKLFNKTMKERKKNLQTDFRNLFHKVKEISDEIINRIEWNEFDFIGFSVCICQLTSTRYFIQEIKKRSPDLFVVAGGSIISGHDSSTLKKIFPLVDLFIKGEGELPLEKLVRERRAFQSIPKFPNNKDAQGINNSNKEGKDSIFDQIKLLDNLSVPEFDDYFRLLSTLPPEKRFFPNIPIEISRGCWWHNKRSKNKKGCAFCNLNFQWEGYRSKTPGRVAAEIDMLSSKHKLLSFSVMDNVLPAKKMKAYFFKIQKLDKELNLFCEVRATTSLRVLKDMKRAGTNNVQIGIESLSTRLLQKLNKGTTAIQNIEIMKNCEELGIANGANLMIHFPGSDVADVHETLSSIEFVIPFKPLNPVEFQLGRGSAVSNNPEKFGLQSVYNHPNYSVLFPENIFSSVDFIQKAYRGDLVYQRKIWKPVKQKLEYWNSIYGDLHNLYGSKPILEFQDGGSFLIIKYRMLNGETATHRLEGTSRKIYLFCRHHRSIKKILGSYNGLTELKLTPFLKMMVDKKLMFHENDRYLSLAVSKVH